MVRFSIECLLPKVLRAMWFSLVGILEFGLHCLHMQNTENRQCAPFIVHLQMVVAQ